MSVGMLNLQAQFRQIREEVMAEVTQIFETQSFILGSRVKGLEEKMAALAGMPYGIGVSSGTDALLLSVMALKPEPGDEVITTPYTFFATASSIVRGGARPVFVDVDDVTFNARADLLEAAVTKRTRALMPVHLFGQMVNPAEWTAVAQAQRLRIIEDAAQAVGATFNGVTAGGFGDLSCFSFYPTKNLGGAGDGGMVLARDEALAHDVRINRVHGGKDRYFHDQIGICGRLDELQAAVLQVKFRYLAQWNERRRAIADMYKQGLINTPAICPIETPGAYHTYHQYVIRAPKRDELMEFLKSRGIGSMIYYPVPLHLQKCFSFLGYKEGDFPVSERLAKETLALPMSAELTDDEVMEVCGAVRDFYSGK
ncbi:MAG: DegT/DnrJ/EryC1/StrS family aminotransferase [Calditrichaeota bacterium]|nr:DegT/DnrJ/EryC1/StrS family aminotransferase [Calditrichota bacterium]MCB9391566.1 DegT/DnrJ/EryC1/StrS family aminotransferase [Calditrichota bacterium]